MCLEHMRHIVKTIICTSANIIHFKPVANNSLNCPSVHPSIHPSIYLSIHPSNPTNSTNSIHPTIQSNPHNPSIPSHPIHPTCCRILQKCHSSTGKDITILNRKVQYQTHESLPMISFLSQMNPESISSHPVS